jgi:carbon monoxide dehydrogenase subunit G
MRTAIVMSGCLISFGGRSRARRTFVVARVLLAGLMPGFAVRASEDVRVTSDLVVVEANGLYSVTANFHVPQTPAAVVTVLTNYEQIPRFMPGVKTSVVLERTPGGAVVEQEAVSRLLMFSKRVHLILEVTETPATVRFRDRCGKSFSFYEGRWSMSASDGGTDVRYELKARPTFGIPDALLTRLLRRDSTRMIESLRQEIAGTANRR